jgi:hypothetical protein
MNVKLLADAKYDGIHRQIGDEFGVDCITGIAWCNAGIAIDLDGVLPTAPQINTVQLDVQNGCIGATSKRI